MRLDLEKVGWLSSDVWAIRSGQRLTKLAVGTMRERVDFAVGDRAYSVRKSDADGVLVLTDIATGLPLAQRTKLGVFSSDYDVEAQMPDGAVHVIRMDRGSGWKSRYELRVGAMPVGEVVREGMWKSTMYADVPDAWPLPVAVFVAWLALRQFASEEGAAGVA